MFCTPEEAIRVRFRINPEHVSHCCLCSEYVMKPGLEVIKLFSYSTELSMNFCYALKFKNIKKFGFF